MGNCCCTKIGESGQRIPEVILSGGSKFLALNSKLPIMAIISSPAETPLMKQYNAIKTKYPGALLLFRVGDFYETFGEDAIRAAAVLDITLTKRGNGSAS